MTPEDITRLNELYAKSENEPDISNREFSKGMFALEAHLAWPAISAELARLREFEAAVRKHGEYGHTGRSAMLDRAIDDLDRKRGEHDAT